MNRVLVIGNRAEISVAIAEALRTTAIPVEFAAGDADALLKLRKDCVAVVITNPDSAIAEDLALLEEMRLIHPGVKCIVLAAQSSTEDVIAALRARVFACFTPPFDPSEIACLAQSAVSEDDTDNDFKVVSARPGWVTVRVVPRLINADRLLTFIRKLAERLPDDARQDVMQGFREILLNAMEHGAAFNPDQVVEVSAVRTARSCVFYVRDPGTGFRPEAITHAAVANPADDPAAHTRLREEQGMRPGGFGLLLAKGTVDELLYNEIGNEVLLIKYVNPADRPK